MNRETIRHHMIAEEGLKLTPYYCTGDPPQLTIGVGHNLDSRGISEGIAMAILDEDIDMCLSELSEHFPHWNDYPEPVQVTLIDLCFNLGITRLLKFKKTIEYINEGLATGNYTKAATELMDSAYARQLPNRAKRNHDRLFNA